MLKALIVDDDKLVRKGLISVMPWNAYGIEVVGDVNSGEKALEFLEKNEVNLLITDIVMPVMTGMELMKIVKKKYPGVWIVLLTFYQSFEYIQEALRHGAIDYILKTHLEKEQMSDVLARIVSRIQSEESLRSPSVQNDIIKPKAQLSFEIIQELIQEWSSFQWIHHDEIYKQQLDKLQRLQPSASNLESIFHSAVAALKKCFSLIDEPYEFNTVEGGMRWEDWLNRIGEIRSSIQKRTRKPFYSKEVVQSIMKALDWINSAVEEDIKQEDLAREVNMSRGYFSQCFRDIVGKPFNEYIRNVTIERAKHLLVMTDHPVYRIAEKLGYQSEKYFSRIFKEKCGVLPTEYRSKNAQYKKC